MQRESSETILSAVFVDYDNVYLSLKRKSEEAAKRFAKDASSWIRQIASGALITPTNSAASEVPRRLVMNRCYGNPVPRRNASDNSTDMNSFAFVRHHFLRSGFEIIDCPPLTAQLKNSSDIRMVMDIRDYLDHKTDFDEFIILSSDADFTPVLHRLRSYAKRTVIFANDNTVAPYTALSDGEVRESDLIAYLLEQRSGGELTAPNSETQSARDQIIEQVVQAVLEAEAPLPLEALAERAIRALGHDKTVGGNWAGAGSFRELLVADLPEKIKLTGEPPYLAYEAGRQLTSQRAPQSTPAIERQPEPTPMNALPTAEMPAAPAPLADGPTATGMGLDIRAEPTPLAAQPAPAPTPTALHLHLNHRRCNHRRWRHGRLQQLHRKRRPLSRDLPAANCSSRSRGSTKPARRLPSHHLNIGHCSESLRRRSRRISSRASRRWRMSFNARPSWGLRSDMTMLAICSMRLAMRIRGSNKGRHQPCSPVVFATSS